MTTPSRQGAANQDPRRGRILMLLENESYPDDTRVRLEAGALSEAGFQLTVICPTGDSRQWYEQVGGVHVYRYPKPWEFGGFFGYLWEYGYSLAMALIVSLFVLVRCGFDVVHTHAPPDMFVVIARFYQLLGKRYVVDMHDLSPELYQAQRDGNGNRWVHAALCCFERWSCRAADRLISTNESQRRVQIERGGAAAERCRVVRNGPDAKFLAPIEPLPSLASNGKTIIGYVGMIGVQDGVEYLLRAAACLKNELGRNDFLVVIVGDGPALGEIKKLANELELGSAVQFAGYHVGDGLLRYIASFDMGITPDPSNPYNDSCTTIKTMEYMALGKPVVAFDLPENRHTAGGAALYAEGNSTFELAERMVRLIDDPPLRDELGERGCRRITDQFRWEHQRQRLIELYDELLSPRRQTVRVDEAVGDTARPEAWSSTDRRAVGQSTTV